MNRRQFLLTAAAATLAAPAMVRPGMAAGAARDLKMVAAFPETFIYTREMALPFMKLVADETGGSVSVSL
ncbi:MAG: hypothetical protein WAU86_21130, partial [Oricola sp.]